MDPPFQTEKFLSGGVMILILMVLGAWATISFCILSAIVVSHLVNARGLHSQRLQSQGLKFTSMQAASISSKDGWNRASGHLNL